LVLSFYLFLIIKIKFYKSGNINNLNRIKYCLMGIGDWGLGIGDWGLGVGSH